MQGVWWPDEELECDEENKAEENEEKQAAMVEKKANDAKKF